MDEKRGSKEIEQGQETLTQAGARAQTQKTPEPVLEKRCPECEEPVKPTWDICPCCETSLVIPACPQCGLPVKENWKLCPECKTRLICSSCNTRISDNLSTCPGCEAPILKATMPEAAFTDPVTGMAFIFVAAGEFLMGDGFDDGSEDEAPVHEVRLDGFYMGVFPVTQGQWKQVMKTNPSKFSRGDDYPVEQVSWEDVQLFIRQINELNIEKYDFGLPTEAQWEYAARSGGENEKYAGSDDVDATAWYNENSRDATHPVGKRAPNGLGLYDMSGNVWEWCRDVYNEDAYRIIQKVNPVWADDGNYRVIRGGSWNTDAWSARCARRFSFSPDYFGGGLGVRLVINL